MPLSPRNSFRPRCESLETREVPAALFAESFDRVKTPATPAGWQSWVNDSTYPYITSAMAAATGPAGLASLGGLGTSSRFWNTTLVPGDSGAAASVKTGNPAATGVVARGLNLNTAAPSYLAAVVQSGGRVDLVEVKSGVSTALGSVTPTQAVRGPWLRVAVQPFGTSATVQVQRLDTGAYLSPAGVWQSTAVNALSKTVTWNPPQGLVGIARSTGGSGMVYVDDVTATPAPPVKQSFDATAVGGLPAGWQSWKNDDAAGFRVTAGRALTGANGLSSDGRSPSQSRAWFNTAMPADVQASAAVFTDTVIPASLFVRGQNLATAKPTYYAVSVSRGLTVQLTKTVNGVTTTLGSVKSKDYLSYQWVNVTLTANAGSVRAVVYRTDTKQWLGGDGTWQSWPDAALEAADGTINGPGFAGLARGAGAAGAVTFDDFTVQAASAVTAPVVNVQASQVIGSVKGDVTFTATTTPAGAANRVEFRLDGVLKSAAAAGTGSWTLDTTLISNGSHTLTVRAVDGSGNVGTGTLTFTVANPNPTPPPARPDLAAHRDWIRIAQLAYSGTPIDAFTIDKLKNDVDLIIPNPQYLSAVDAASPNTPQIIYSNVSNLYQGLLTNWLDYADKAGVSRELAFYHVSAPSGWSGASPSSQAVNQFWGVYKTPATGDATDLTAAAYGGRSFGVPLGIAGESVALGYPEKFRELNVALNKPAGSTWRYAIEYASKVGADGAVTEWKTLPVSQDGSGGFTKDGRLTFDPPADWAAGTVAGSARYFYMRIRTTAGGADAPEARTLLGRDYAGANGGIKGTIPAFDAAADKDGDGYLTDAEYAARRAGFDARFAYESRLFYPNYGQQRFVTNPAASAVRRWAAGFHQQILAANPLADGFFIDNSNGKLPIAGIPVVEPTTTYSDDAANLVLAVAKAVAPKLVFVNTVGGTTTGNQMAAVATGSVEEFLLRPMEANWSAVLDAANLVRGRLAADTPSPYVVLDTHPAGGAVDDPRTQIGALAYYYLLADPDRTMVMFFGGYTPAAAWQHTWIGAVSADVGDPTGAMAVVASGADPQNAKLQYRVFGRTYENGMVLYKPRSYTLGVGTGTADDATATTVQLGGSYYLVAADGTVGKTAVTQVSLRNAEGVVLLKA
jgi:hypothetical protein